MKKEDCHGCYFEKCQYKWDRDEERVEKYPECPCQTCLVKLNCVDICDRWVNWDYESWRILKFWKEANAQDATIEP